MILYHYRSMDSALKEIGGGTFHFASREELNDPIEGFVSVYWQGDKAAWEGLLRNYICSLYHGIELYLLKRDENCIHHESLAKDIHAFDHVPLGDIWKRIGDQFVVNKIIQRMTEYYGDKRLKVKEEELRLILNYIHNIAIDNCIRSYIENKIIPEEEGKRIIESFRLENPPFPNETIDEKQRVIFSKIVEEFIEDIRELKYIDIGFDDDSFLFGKKNPEGLTDARQRRDWLTIAVDFPKVYVEQLKEMIYPKSYTVCFSTKNNNSAMWGNYANSHKGVCLVYDFDDASDSVNKPRPVYYEGELIERNFFETFGRFTISQIKEWLKGTDGISDCYKSFSDVNAWRDNYWKAYEAKTYRKMKAWEYEQEYRITRTDMFNDLNTPESRNIKYDPKILKGIIFGIRTSEYDKKCIMEKLVERREELGEIKFWQAEYDDANQEINIREKAMWKL